MIHDLDLTLEKLLTRELPSDYNTSIAISFLTPDEKFSTAVPLPALNLFLYDVRENRELRTNGWHSGRDAGGAVTRERPPVRVDCSYLVTAWMSDTSHDEHWLLGEAILALLRYPSLPAPILQGRLAAATIEPPTSTLQRGHLQGVAELWQALGGKPRAAFNYTVTIAVQPSEPTPAAAPVTDKRLVFDVGSTLGAPESDT